MNWVGVVEFWEYFMALNCENIQHHFCNSKWLSNLNNKKNIYCLILALSNFYLVHSSLLYPFSKVFFICNFLLYAFQKEDLNVWRLVLAIWRCLIEVNIAEFSRLNSSNLKKFYEFLKQSSKACKMKVMAQQKCKLDDV